MSWWRFFFDDKDFLGFLIALAIAAAIGILIGRWVSRKSGWK